MILNELGDQRMYADKEDYYQQMERNRRKYKTVDVSPANEAYVNVSNSVKYAIIRQLL